MKSDYIELVKLVERLQRQCLDNVKLELERLGIRDLNPVQALILYNLGDEELTVGELSQRGYYLGSNVSYNVRKMAEHGYLLQHRSPFDGRAVNLRASQKGADLQGLMDALFERQAQALGKAGVDPAQLGRTVETLARLTESSGSGAQRAA